MRRCSIQLKQSINYDPKAVHTGNLPRRSRKLEAVIFDIDGTLVDSVDFHAKAWQRAFKKFGKAVSSTDVRSQIGKGGDQLLPVFLSPTELEKFGKDLEECRSELYRQEYLPRVKAFPQVRELFERIRKDRRRIALASSAKEDELKTYKKIAQIDHLIQAETSADDAENFETASGYLRGGAQRIE